VWIWCEIHSVPLVHFHFKNQSFLFLIVGFVKGIVYIEWVDHMSCWFYRWKIRFSSKLWSIQMFFSFEGKSYIPEPKTRGIFFLKDEKKHEWGSATYAGKSNFELGKQLRISSTNEDYYFSHKLWVITKKFDFLTGKIFFHTSSDHTSRENIYLHSKKFEKNFKKKLYAIVLI